MFLANIDVRLSPSRVYMFLYWYVYLTFKKYNINYSLIIVFYFWSVIPIIRLFDYPIYYSTLGRIIGVLL